MNVLSVTKENKMLYSGFIPEELSYMLFLDEMVCLGLIDDDTEGAVPAGLCIYSSDDNGVITMEWLFVDEPYRGNGYSQQLIDTVMETALMNGTDFIRAKLWTGGPVTDEQEDFCYDRGFLPAVPDKKDRIFYFDSLKMTLLKKYKSNKSVGSIISFSELPSAVTNAQRVLFFENINIPSDIDPMVSKAVIADGRIKSVLIVRRTGIAYYPSLLYTASSDDTDTEAMLISNALYEMQWQDGPDGFLCLCCTDYDPLAAIAGFFRGDAALASHGYELSSDFQFRDNSMAKQKAHREKEYYDSVDSISTEMVMTGVIYE